MNLGIIIQARTSSTRLKNKILLPFYNNISLIKIIIEQFKHKFPHIPLVVATTTNKNDDILIDHIKDDVDIYRGSELDVLDRVIKTSEKFKFDYVVRICSDNPFLNMLSIERMIFKLSEFIVINKHVDYIGYTIDNNLPSIRSHIGVFSEIVCVNALKTAYEMNTITDFDKEHVTYFIHSNNNIFSNYLIEYTNAYCLNNLRLTLDTKDDFDILSAIYKRLYKRNTDFSLDQIIDIVNNNPYYKTTMNKMILLFSK